MNYKLCLWSKMFFSPNLFHKLTERVLILPNGHPLTRPLSTPY